MVDGAALEKRCAKAPWVRIPPSPPGTHAFGRACTSVAGAGHPHTNVAARIPPPRRGRLVDYGAALEMRFGESRRGFESRPLRHHAGRSNHEHCCRRLGTRSAVDSCGRARRGTSGALYLQSAPAGLNSLQRPPSSSADASSDVEGRVPRSGEPRTVSGPEGSSTKRSSSGAADRPGLSRASRWARERDGRRRVHGFSAARGARGVR